MRPPTASLPPGVRAYVIGDVHGRADLLHDCRARIIADSAERPIAQPLTITLGDYIDRGPDSYRVIELLTQWPDQAPLLALRGNHEEMLLNFLHDPGTLEGWRRLGAIETLHSYGVPLGAVMRGEGFDEARQQLLAGLPPAHLAFLEQTGASIALGDYFFCHAGVRPGVALEAQSPTDLLWIRNEFLDSPADFGAVVVHGHTPVAEPDVRRNRINIDTGAYATGRLTCLVLESDQARLL